MQTKPSNSVAWFSFLNL